MRDRSDLAKCAVHCCHCGIRFLTHPRNAHRRDLRCEFGCREQHRRQQANARSKRHYQTPHGRKNKKSLNGKRSVAGVDSENVAPADEGVSPYDTPSSCPAPAPQPASRATRQPARDVLQEVARQDVTSLMDGFALDEVTLVNSSLLPYLAMVASVLERRRIGVTELLQVLRKSMRQRSFDRLPRREYVFGFLNQHPP